MGSEDVLRQLIWRHENLLADLQNQLVGASGWCTLHDAAGQQVWTSRAEASACVGAESIVGSAFGPARCSIAIGEYGRLLFHSSTEVPPPDPTEAALLGSLGQLMTNGLEAEEEFSQLVEDHVSNTNQLIALYNIINATHETWGLSGKLEEMIEEAGRQTSASLALIHVDDGAQSHLAWWPADPAAQDRVDRLWDRVRELPAATMESGPDGFVAAPILHGEKRVGWLAAQRASGDSFLQRDLKLVEALAELTGEFLITARLQDQVVANSKLEREIEIASQIQEMLMPRRLPSLPSMEFAATCRPASHVGGDFYVVQELPDGRCAFALGDVTGKGVPAALIMAMTRTVFRALGRFGMSPDEVLQQLSDVLYDDLEEVGKFVTVLLGIYDPKSARVLLANAGHSPVLYSAPGSDQFVAIEPLLPPLGVMRELDPPPIVFDLGPGALLVAATDGITEARTIDGSMYGEDRLLALLEARRNESAAEILDAVIEDTREFTQGAPQSDDQTILLLKGR